MQVLPDLEIGDRRLIVGLAADLSLMSTTQAGAMKAFTGMVSTELFGRFLARPQWTSASQAIAGVLPIEKLFQYQAEARSS